MAKKPYDEVSVLRELNKKSGCLINGKEIKVLRNSPDLGNSTWGKIDYLCKVHDYTWSITDSITKSYVNNSARKSSNNKDKVINKGSNNKDKFNMASRTKTAMRNASSK